MSTDQHVFSDVFVLWNYNQAIRVHLDPMISS